VQDRYIFTNHARAKMKHYGISESLVKRIIRYPDRIEEAIVEDLIAAMKKTNSNKFPEVWTMYTPIKEDSGKIKVITAWKFPGESSSRDPIPQSVIDEVRSIIGI
jgi:hypothetical protein